MELFGEAGAHGRYGSRTLKLGNVPRLLETTMIKTTRTTPLVLCMVDAMVLESGCPKCCSAPSSSRHCAAPRTPQNWSLASGMPDSPNRQIGRHRSTREQASQDASITRCWPSRRRRAPSPHSPVSALFPNHPAEPYIPHRPARPTFGAAVQSNAVHLPLADPTRVGFFGSAADKRFSFQRGLSAAG